MRKLLEIENLVVHFDTDGGLVEVLDNVNFTMHAGEIVGLVGESGSGKSVSATAILGMIRRPGRILTGSIRFEGVDLLRLSENEMRNYRGRRIAMISQSPRTSLNPVISVGRQISRIFAIHERCSRVAARQRALELLDLVGVADPARRMQQYPHQLSGGMCQRVMIAMALATSPQLLIADEPTTGLDVSIAARILDLLCDLSKRTGAAILLITHDLGVVARTCERVAVMHAGQMVETAPVRQLFRFPAHPYTRALVRSIPRIDTEIKLEPIPGVVPSLLHPPIGCRYQNRCPHAMDICRRDKPRQLAAGQDHEVACFAFGEHRDAAA
jgi:oligopeptide/dipeptide ABC transporter ATP-binding protein